MPKKMVLLALMAGAIVAPLAARAATIQLKSVKVELPQSDQMFTGQGADVINNNCLACHSADMVLNQPELAKAAWQAEVTKMIQVFKAPIAVADAGAIVAYLARTKSPGN
jgi:mono/diheme cytochrome c family protein